jgi:uncharacterized protein (DUF1800 family)
LQRARQTFAVSATSVPTALLAIAVLSSPAIAQLPPSSASLGPGSAAVRIIPLTERERAVHLLSRATYGVRPADLDEVMRRGREAWLEAQLHPETIEIGPRVPAQAVYGLTMLDAQPTLLRQPSALAYNKISRAAFSARQLEEVMTDFWFNHFNVYVLKDAALLTMIAHYEDRAIRNHVFGRFEDMLVATARHPAMLVYLDNYLSTVPNADTIRGVGINENYARELLELHTLGVDGGYTQRDVIEVARAFTGWGVQTTPRFLAGALRITVGRGQTEMLFDLERHDQSSKVVMSLELPAGRGIEDGLDVLGMLSRHPSTARHIATKLVTHFVSDEPHPQLVAELAGVFLATDGDLRAVTRTLFSSDVFYDRAHFRAKAKRPFEFLVSALRVTGRELQAWSATARVDPPPSALALYALLRQMGHVPYSEPAPAGYPSVAAEWINAGTLMGRMTFAANLAESQLEPGVSFDPFEALGLSVSGTAALLSPGLDGVAVEGLPAMTDLVIERLMPGLEVPELRFAIVQDLSQRTGAYPGGLLARAIALTLGSPHFQKY